jgi:transcriptional regulator with AAA-type ATPase domain
MLGDSVRSLLRIASLKLKTVPLRERIDEFRFSVESLLKVTTLPNAFPLPLSPPSCRECGSSVPGNIRELDSLIQRYLHWRGHPFHGQKFS